MRSRLVTSNVTTETFSNGRTGIISWPILRIDFSRPRKPPENTAAARNGRAKTIQVDNGPQFISKNLGLGAYMNGVTLDFSRSGKPT